MKFGQYLKILRKDKFTQKQFADILGVDHSYISKLENGKAGKPTDLTLYRISKVLKLDALDLFFRAGKFSAKTVSTLRNNPELIKSLAENIGFPTSDLDVEQTQKLSVFYQLPLASILINLEDMLIADANFTALNLYQYDKEALVNNPISILEFDDAVDYENHSESDDYEGTISLNTKFTQHITKNKDIISVKIITSPIFIKSKLYILKIIERLDHVYFEEGSSQCSAIESARIFEHAPLPTFLFTIDDDGKPNNFLYSNAAATDLTGFTKQELLKLDPFILNLDDDKDIICGLFDVLHIEFQAFATTTVLAKDGSSTKCCLSATLNTINKNDYVYIVITETLA